MTDLTEMQPVVMYGILAVNGILTTMVIFFLGRILRKADRHDDMGARIQVLANESAKMAVELKSIYEIHQYFGVIKNQHLATFKRIDELRDDYKELKSTIEGNLSSLRKDYYQLKAKVDAEIPGTN